MLYTGKGDNGTTKLFGCTERIAKDEPRLEALGNLDELNSYIGMCRALAFAATARDIKERLVAIQEDLFIIQAQVAGAKKGLSPERISLLEDAIAGIEAEIPPVTSFTITGATVLSGALDVARTIARRTERSIVTLRDDALKEDVIPYLNRLSSALFALARLAAHRAHIKEQSPRY